MPTTRPRHTITETDPIAHALDEAAKRWPEDSDNRTKLLLHLVDEGRRAVRQQRERAVAARREVILRTAGTLTGVYGENYLADLRKDRPE